MHHRHSRQNVQIRSLYYCGVVLPRCVPVDFAVGRSKEANGARSGIQTTVHIVRHTRRDDAKNPPSVLPLAMRIPQGGHLPNLFSHPHSIGRRQEKSQPLQEENLPGSIFM
jgi:hypothetical protein